MKLRVVIGLLAVSGMAAAASGQGQLTWVKQFGTPAYDFGYAISPEPDDKIFASWWDGEANHSTLLRLDKAGDAVQLATVPGVLIAKALPDGSGGYFLVGGTGQEVWVGRCTANGEVVWSDLYGDAGAGGFNQNFRVVTDGAGGVFGVSQHVVKVGDVTAQDFQVSRYTFAGEQLWLKTYGKPGGGTEGLEEVNGAASDGAGGLFVSGITYSEFFEPNPNRDPMKFIARIDSAGSLVWGEHFGSGNARAVCPDGAGGCFVAGHVEGGPLNAEIYIARVDGAGGLLWESQYGSPESDRVREIAAIPGGFLVAGETKGDVGGPNAGFDDAFMVAHDSTGAVQWAAQFGTPFMDRLVGSLAVSASGTGILLSGFTEGDLGGVNAGGPDAFFARLTTGASCYADFTGDGALDLFDFLAFVNGFNAGDPAADCVADGVLDLFDFLCFVNAFNEGC